jgi:hypothetical protein
VFREFSANFASALAITVVLAGAASASAEPAEESAPRTVLVSTTALEGLLLDLERIVAAEDASGWFLDRAALDAIHPVVMESACRAGAPVRLRALDLLRAEQATRGKPEVVYQEQGRELTSDVYDALQTDRELRALERAHESSQDCPFWVSTSDFRGLQTYRSRFLISLETGGVGQLRHTAGAWTFGGGGAGRLLAGYGLRAPISVLGGLEFGGGALLDPGSEPTQLIVNYFPAIPLVVRIHGVSWHYDFEVAAVSQFQANDFDLGYGGRFGFGIGVSALRTRGFIPWAGAAVAYDHYFETGGRERAHFLRAGLRVGAVYDP